MSPQAPLSNLLKGEERLEQRVQTEFGKEMTRFTERDISALLQHYGVCTTWMDVVDNLFVAVWFALNKSAGGRHEPSKEQHGWIKFIQPSRSGFPELRVKDLRCDFLQHSLRLHAQHGASVSRRARSHWHEANLDLRGYVIANVRIPNNPVLWQLCGFMFRDEFLFPAADHDATYRVMIGKAMTSILREVEKECSLPSRTLGVIERPRDNRDAV